MSIDELIRVISATKIRRKYGEVGRVTRPIERLEFGIVKHLLAFMLTGHSAKNYFSADTQIPRSIAMKPTTKPLSLTLLTVLSMWVGIASAQVSKEVLESISTPDKVETSIGTLKFLDGAPYPETAEEVYDYIDTMRGVDAFLKGIPGASVHI
jgi:hypothetical protein